MAAPGSDNPSPTACIVVNDEVIGWVDYDHDRDHDWLGLSEVNLGYFVFAPHRRKGHASRAVGLLVGYLQEKTDYKMASLLVDPRNGPVDRGRSTMSLYVRRRAQGPALFQALALLNSPALYFENRSSVNTARITRIMHVEEARLRVGRSGPRSAIRALAAGRRTCRSALRRR